MRVNATLQTRELKHHAMIRAFGTSARAGGRPGEHDHWCAQRELCLPSAAVVRMLTPGAPRGPPLRAQQQELGRCEVSAQPVRSLCK
jgi:hypothetical protein